MQLKDKFDGEGHRISPELPDEVQNYLIDIDGTICEDIPNEEPERMKSAKELPGAKEMVNKWYDAGHIITFFSSRTEEHRKNTEEWLKEHGFKYHKIIFGKPRGGNYHWIDDRTVRATRFVGKFTPFVKAKKEILVFEE